MSEALKQRVRRHLEAGVEPTLKGRRAVLKDVVLVKADGREAPVVEEARRLVPNIDLSYWSGETERQRNRVFAFDREGNRHTVTQRRAGEQVATKAGRRFYEEAPQTEWIIHLPVVEVRGGKKFNERYIDLTPDGLKSIYEPTDPEYALLKLNRTRGDNESLDRMISQYQTYLPRALSSTPCGAMTI